MALILKSTKLLYKGIGLTRQTRLTCLKNDNSLLQWKNLLLVNALFKKDYATPSPKIMSADVLERSIYQLDLDLRYRNRIFKKDIEQILRSIEHWGDVSYKQSLLLLGSCASFSFLASQHERVNLCMDIWKVLEKTGMKLDISHYNTLLNVYVENEHIFSPENFLKELEEKGLQPDLVTYQRLLRAHCFRGDIAAASDLLEKMRQNGLPLNEFIFNSLIYCHCQIGDINSAYGIMDLMKEKGIETTSDTYRNLLCGLAKNGHIDKINEVLQQCEEKDILIMDRDMLELVYILASSGYTNEASNILKKVKKQHAYSKYASLTVYKLLQKQLDSVALDVFCTIEKQAGDIENRSTSKFLMDYYVTFRSVKEALEICVMLKDKGFSTVPFNYTLKKFVTEESLDRCFELFHGIRRLTWPLRTHYFWPLIIKAKAGGNSEIIQVLHRMKKFNVSPCFFTVTKILFPNYGFGSEWMNSIETLKNYGVDERSLTWKLMDSFLSNNRITDAETLASSRPVGMPNTLGKSMVGNLLLHPENVKSIVRIMFCLCHDHRLVVSREEPTEEAEERGESEELEASNDNGRNGANGVVELFFHNLLKTSQDAKETVRSVLQTMIEEKVPLPKETASLIREKFGQEEFGDLLTELTEMEFKPNEHLESLKEISSPKFSRIRRLAMAQDPSAEDLWEKEGRQPLLDDLIGLIFLHIKLGNTEKAMEFCRMLSTDNASSLSRDHNDGPFKSLLRALSKEKKTEDLIEAITIGMNTNILSKEDYGFLIHYYLNMNMADKAVDLFCEICAKEKLVVGYFKLAEVLVEEKETELLKKVTSAVADVKGESTGLTLLMLQFLNKGLVKQAKKLLEIKGFVVSLDVLYDHCRKLYRKNSADGLEALLEITKGVLGIDRGAIYLPLLRLYARQRNVEKVEELWLQMQQDGYPANDTFVWEMSKFLSDMGRNPPVSLSLMEKENHIKRRKDDSSERQNDEKGEKIIEDQNKEKPAFKLAEKGNVEEVLSIVKNRSNRGLFQGVCISFLKNNKFEEYLQFMKEVINSDSKKNINHCFFSRGMEKFVENSDLFEEYKKIAIQAFEELKILKPLGCYWVLCLQTTDHAAEAEKIFDEYIAKDIKTFATKMATGLLKHNPMLPEFILQNPKYNSEPELAATCYSLLITNKLRKNDVEKAEETLNEAAKEGLADYIDVKVIVDLKSQLIKAGKNFSHEELLERVKLTEAKSA